MVGLGIGLDLTKIEKLILFFIIGYGLLLVLVTQIYK